MISKGILENLNEKKKEFKTSPIFPHIVFDDFLDEETGETMFLEIKDSSEKGMPYFGYNFKKYALNNIDEFGSKTRSLINYLNSQNFVNILIELTGIENLIADPQMEGGGLHFVKENGYLNIHSDFESHIIKSNYKRRLNLLIYFNKNWSKENNGSIEFWDRSLSNHIEYEPIHNRAIIFQTDKYSYHGHPKKLKPPDQDRIRKSIALYYYTVEKERLPLKETNFVAMHNYGLLKKTLMNVDQNILRLYSFCKRNGMISDNITVNIVNRILRPKNWEKR